MPGHLLSSEVRQSCARRTEEMLYITMKMTWSKAALMKINGTHGRDIGKHFYMSKKCERRTRMRQRAVWNCDRYLNSFFFFFGGSSRQKVNFWYIHRHRKSNRHIKKKAH